MNEFSTENKRVKSIMYIILIKPKKNGNHVTFA